MKNSFIYFLVDADEANARFKIGQSIDPYRRHKSLVQTFDLEKSWQFECAADDVRQIEQEIHEHCAPYQIDPEEFGYINGRTEWFRIECLDNLLEQVRHPKNAKVFGMLSKVERKTKPVQVYLPEALYRKIRYAKMINHSTIQQEVLAVLEAHYAEQPSYAQATAD